MSSIENKVKKIHNNISFKDVSVTNFKQLESYSKFVESMYNEQLDTLYVLDKWHIKECNKDKCGFCEILKKFTDKFNDSLSKATETNRNIFAARQSEENGVVSSIVAEIVETTAAQCTPNTGCRKLENPIFFGDDKKIRIEDWFHQMEIRMNIAATPEGMKIQVLSTFLKGATARIATNFIDANINNYTAFKTKMIEKFTDRYARVEDLDKFHLLKQANFTSFRAFIMKFTELADRLKLDEDTMLERLLAQLKPEYARLVKSNPNIIDFDSAETYCHQLESNDRVNTVNNINTVTKCTYCGKNNHTVDRCYKKTNDAKKKVQDTNTRFSNKDKVSDFKIKCFKCNRLGHKANSCKVKKIFNINLTEEPTEKINKVFNFYSSGSEIPWTMCRVNNSEKVFKIGLDTAADFSLISYACVKELSLVSVYTPMTYTLADKSDRKACLKYPNVLIDISGYTLDVDFYDIGNDLFDLILGIKDMNRMKMGIFGYLNLLRFPSGDVKLNVEDIYNVCNVSNPEWINDIHKDNKVVTPFDGEELLENIEWSAPPAEISTEIKLDPKQENDFLRILNENTDRFAHSAMDLEKSDFLIFDACIERPDEPVYTRPYRYSSIEEDEIERQINEWLSCGQVVHSKSRWSSPCLLVDKQDKTKRVVIDYRRVNKRTKKEPFPLGHIESLLARIAVGNYFSVLDFKSGFQQVLINPKVAQYFAFSTNKSHFEPRVMQFGMNNAPMHFSKLMQLLLGDLPYVVIFIDDLVIYTSSFEDHLTALKTVFHRIREAKLKLNRKKCRWLCKRIEYLGYIIEDGFVKMSRDKVEKIIDRVAPKNVKELQAYMGLVNYYRKFIKDFAGITACMTELLKKGVKYEWSSECGNSYEKLKVILTSKPILRLPDFTKAYIIDVDSSNRAIGAVLSQIDDEGREYAVYFASRTLKKAELNYTISEKECLAVVFGLIKFRTYVFGREFKVRTDHTALKWLMTIDTPISRLCRWSIFIQSFGDFVIEYRPGKQHGNADCLSRAEPVEIPTILLIESTEPFSKDIYKNKALMFFVKNKEHVYELPKHRRTQVENEALHHSIDEYGVWYIRDLESVRFLFVPEIDKRKAIIERYHLLGHYLTQTTYDRIIDKFYWHDIKNDVKIFIANCGPCQRNEIAKVYNHPAKAIKTDRVFSSIRLDYIHGLPTTDKGNNCILNIVDSVSSWFELYALPSKEAANSVSCLLDWCCRYGAPDEILSDRGNEFMASLVTEFCTNVGIEKLVTAAYNPRTNGKVERLNNTIIISLRKHCENDNRSWDKWLSYVMMAYRSRVNTTTKFSPYELVFGTIMNTFDPTPEISNKDNECLNQRVSELKNLAEKIRPKASINIENSQIRQIDCQNKRHNVQTEALKPGTRVLIVNDGIIPKLNNRYKGSYKIVSKDHLDNYEIIDDLGNIVDQKYPLQKLKVVPEEELRADTKIAEIEKILNHKTENNEKYYLIKWKNYPKEDNEWVHESDCNSKIMINKYLKNVAQPKRARGRPKTINFLSILSFLFILILCMDSVNSAMTKVTGDFKYCLGAYQKTPINRNNLCNERSSKVDPKGLIDFNNIVYNNHHVRDDHGKHFISFDVYTKENRSVIGVGYECSAIVYDWSFGLTVFGYRWKTMTKKVLKLETRECAVMTKSESCFGKKMTCAEKICEYEGEVIEQYSIWGTVNKQITNCVMKKRTLTATNVQAHLFDTNCLVSDYYCRLPKSIIIWEENVIKNCPFKRILKNVEFEVSTLTFFSKKHNLAFKFRGVQEYCETKIIKTYEGAYLTSNNNEHFYQKTDLPDNDNNVDLLRMVELNLASIDYSTINARTDSKNLFKKQCTVFESLVNSASIANDKYFKFKDYRNNDLILYSLYGEIYKPECVNVNEIFFDNNPEKCYKDFEIVATVKGKNISSFLSHYGIIKTHSQELPCINDLIRTVPIPNQVNYIINKNNIQKVVNVNEIKLEEVTFVGSGSEETIFHDDILHESLFNMLHENENQVIQDFVFPKSSGYELVSEDAVKYIRNNTLIYFVIGFVLLLCCFSCCQTGWNCLMNILKWVMKCFRQLKNIITKEKPEVLRLPVKKIKENVDEGSNEGSDEDVVEGADENSGEDCKDPNRDLGRFRYHETGLTSNQLNKLCCELMRRLELYPNNHDDREVEPNIDESILDNIKQEHLTDHEDDPVIYVPFPERLSTI